MHLMTNQPVHQPLTRHTTCRVPSSHLRRRSLMASPPAASSHPQRLQASRPSLSAIHFIVNRLLLALRLRPRTGALLDCLRPDSRSLEVDQVEVLRTFTVSGRAEKILACMFGTAFTRRSSSRRSRPYPRSHPPRTSPWLNLGSIGQPSRPTRPKPTVRARRSSRLSAS